LPSKVDFVDRVLSRIDRLDRLSVQNYVSGLVREKKQIEDVLDQINEGVLLLDAEGNVKFANRRAFSWLGFQRFLKGRSSVLTLTDDPGVREFLLDCLERPGSVVSKEIEVLSPREMFLWFHWIPLDSENGSDTLIRIENLTQVLGRNEEEARLQRIEGLVRLAAGVAHEIGNPLNSIQIHIDLLKREIQKLPKLKSPWLTKYLEILGSETKRLDQIIRSFLRTTRRPPSRFRRESINEVLEDAVKFLSPEMNRQKIRVKLYLEKNLPEFLLDRDRMREAFINLIKNAIEAMPDGGALKVSTSFRERLCKVRFEDEGRGIADDDLPHIFEVYYTTKDEGSGLGLAQVYQVIREHGGRIDVKSRLGKGSVFTVALPIRQERLFLPQPKQKEGSL